MIKSTRELTARFYKRFLVRASRLSSRLLLVAASTRSSLISPTCLKNMKTSSRSLYKEEDIFEECRIDWELMKELVLKGIFKGVRAFRSFNVLEIREKVISSVAQTVVAAKKVGIKIGVARLSH